MKKFSRFSREIIVPIWSTILELAKEVSRSHIVVFKGGVVLLGVFLVGMSQTLPILLENEYEAKKLQYKVESTTGKGINELVCTATPVPETCMLAKYKIHTVEKTAKLAINLIFLCFYLGISLIGVAAIGFLDFRDKAKQADHPKCQERSKSK